MTTDNSIPQTRTLPLDPDLHKRYWLFSWQDYKALGGLGDFDGSFDSVAEAKDALNIRAAGNHNITANIIDSQSSKSSAWFTRGAWINAY